MKSLFYLIDVSNNTVVNSTVKFTEIRNEQISRTDVGKLLEHKVLVKM